MTHCDHKFVDSKHCLKCGWEPYEFFVQDERFTSGQPYLTVAQLRHLSGTGGNYAGRFLDDVQEALSDNCWIDLRQPARLIFLPPATHGGDDSRNKAIKWPCMHMFDMPGSTPRPQVCSRCGWARPGGEAT